MYWVIGFFVCWAIVELLAMMISAYDNYGENWIMSLIFTVVIIGCVLLVRSIDEDIDTNQDTMLEAQWPEEVVQIEELENFVVEDTVNNPPIPFLEHHVHMVANDEVVDEPPSKAERPVPSNKFHIDASRRHYNTSFTYFPETGELCGDDTCVKVQLVQHTDGTYWACKRNWGACYEY